MGRREAAKYKTNECEKNCEFGWKNVNMLTTTYFHFIFTFVMLLILCDVFAVRSSPSVLCHRNSLTLELIRCRLLVIAVVRCLFASIIVSPVINPKTTIFKSVDDSSLATEAAPDNHPRDKFWLDWNVVVGLHWFVLLLKPRAETYY